MHDDVKRSWSTRVRLDNRIAFITLLLPTSDLEVPTRATARCRTTRVGVPSYEGPHLFPVCLGAESQLTGTIQLVPKP